MDKKNLILLFSLLAAGFFLMTFIAAVWFLKQVYLEPIPETPTKEGCLRVKDERGVLREICPYQPIEEPKPTSTPKTQPEASKAPKAPYKPSEEEVKKSIEDVQIRMMSEQLKEAQAQMKALEEQMKMR